MNGIMLSIQPKYVKKIASGKKTVEVRNTRPKNRTPFKCYIYCTKGNLPNDLTEIIIDESQNENYKSYFGNGKVIGEFICNEIEYISEHQVFNGKAFIEQSCLTIKELFNYTKKGFYCWHISDLKIYDEPKDIREFYRVKSTIKCENKTLFQMCKLTKETKLCKQVCCKKKKKFITRPPQSWCYVEVL